MNRGPVLLLAPSLLLLTAPANEAAAGEGAGPPCVPVPALSEGAGVVDPFRPPAPRATALNADALVLYRRGQWEEARRLYRDALAADPAFLAPRLNIACSLVRQERFAEAAAEAAWLIEAAYVPWAREVREAADMGALKDRPEMAVVQAALEKSTQRWSAGLSGDLLFVARLRAPLRIPDGDAGADGIFILGPRQELFAWSPGTNRYRQLTAEDGRVLGLLLSSDRRHVLYLTAEKLVRKPNGPLTAALRGVVLHRLDLTSLTSAEPVALAGDVTHVEVRAPRAGLFALRIAGDQTNGPFTLRAADGALIPGPPPRALANGRDDRRAPLILSPAGASGPQQVVLAGACPLVARDRRGATTAPTVEITWGQKKSFTLPAPLGASVSGLPLP